MRLILLASTFLFIAQSSMAQVDAPGRQPQDYLTFGTSYTTWLNAVDTVNINTKSLGYNIGLQLDIPIFKDAVSFAPGIALGVTSVNLESFIGRETTDSANLNNTTFTPIPGSLDFKKYRGQFTSIDIPLEFRFRSVIKSTVDEGDNSISTAPDKKRYIKFGVGVKGGFNMGSFVKYDGTDPSNTSIDLKTKIYELPNVTKFQYGVTGRFGYRLLNIWGYYGLNSVFEEGKSPEFQELTIGISLGIL